MSGLPLHVATWINTENIMFNEKSKSPNNSVMPFIYIPKKK